MAQNYKTGLIITGDASGGIRAIKATDDELGKLNQGFERGSRRSKQFNQDVNATSQGLAVLRRAAAPIAGIIAGMFAANTLQGQINWADQLQKTNLRIGASTEALSQYNYVASLSGVEFNQLTTAWQRQTRRIAEAAAGTGVAVAALDKLNLSAKELNQLKPEEQFERIAEAMQGVESSSERVRLAQQLWDSEGVKLVQIVNSGTDAIASMRAEADALGLTISQDTANAMATYNDEVDKLKFAAQGVSQTLMAELVPAMTAGLQSTNEMIQALGGAEVILGSVKDAATVLAALLAGRYAGAFAAATAAKLAATSQVILYQAALARMAGVSATAAASQTALAIATRGASSAMLLVGGPVGAAVLAAGALGVLANRLDKTAERAANMEFRANELAESLQHMGETSIRTQLAAVTLELANMDGAQEALSETARRSSRTHSTLGADLRNLGDTVEVYTRANQNSTEEVDKMRTQQMALEKALELVSGGARGAANEVNEFGGVTSTTAAAAREAAKQTTTLANSYENLLDRIQLNRRAARQYAQDVGVLNLALATGRMTAVQYMQAMGMLQESFQEAQRETENTAKASEDASRRIANSFLSWETVADNTLRRVDDSGQSLWLGLIDGSESALDTVKRGFQQSLAEIAHMLTTQKLTFRVAGMMGLDTTGMPGGGGFGGLGNLISGGRSLLGLGSAAAPSLAMQGGLSSAALASAGQVAGGATYGGWAGSAASGAALGNSAGLASSIASGISTAMPWIAGGLAIDSLLGGGITKAISGLFGGGNTPFYGEVGSGSGIKAYRTETALGETGFTERQRIEKATSEGTQEWAANLFEASKALDSVIASTARSNEELDAMKAAVNGFSVASGNASTLVKAQLIDRTLVALEAAGHDVTAAWGGLDAEQLAARIEVASGAMSVMIGASDRLNIGFNAASSTALLAASNIAEMAGGIDQLGNLQSSYYQAFFSESERAANLQSDLTQSLASMNMQLPQTREGYRQLVEAQDLHTAAGQRNYAQLLQLAPAFAELVPEMEDVASGVRDFAAELSTARDAITDAESDVRSAYKAFESQSFKQQITLMEMAGDSAAALALQRERELLSIDPLLHETQRVIWSIEDETQAKQEAIGAAKNYATSLAQVSDQLASTFNGINQWIDQRNATTGTPGMNLTEAGDQFARQLVLAQSGDRDALQSITQYADRYLAAGEGMYASGDGFQRIQQDVLDALSELPDQISPEQFLADEIRDALQQAVAELPGGIASSLHPLFDSIDLDASGLIDWNEFYGAFAGMASDDELRRIFEKLDADGTGTISRLEALNRTNEATEGNTQTLEERAREQLQELGGLTDEMTRSTDQMVTLNSSMLSLRDAISTLGVAQDELARIEAERVAAEQAERERISNERAAAQYTATAGSHMAQSVDAIGRAQRGVDAVGLGAPEIAEISRMIEQYAGDDGLLQRDEYGELSNSVEALDEGHYRGVARTLALAARHASLASFNERNAANVGAEDGARVEAEGVNFWDLWKQNLLFDGSHQSGLWNVPFDGYVAELHRDEMVVPAETAGRLRDLPDRGLPMPNVPLPQFPQLGNDDVVQVLNDLRNENKQLRADINRLLGDVKTNTGNTAQAVAVGAERAERQRADQQSELQSISRNSRVKGRTV